MLANVFPLSMFPSLPQPSCSYIQGKNQPFSCHLLLFFGAVTPFREPLGAQGNLKKSPKEEFGQAGISWPWFPVTQVFCSLFP